MRCLSKMCVHHHYKILVKALRKIPLPRDMKQLFHWTPLHCKVCDAQYPISQRAE